MATEDFNTMSSDTKRMTRSATRALKRQLEASDTLEYHPVKRACFGTSEMTDRQEADTDNTQWDRVVADILAETVDRALSEVPANPTDSLTAKVSTAEKVQGEFPGPESSPEVWADIRQQLCDALFWFKSHQGGVYTSRLVAKGFLVDKEVELRDYIDAEVIITSM